MSTVSARIDDLKAAVKKWNSNRNNLTKATSYLNSGNCFEITRSDYETWDGMPVKPDFIHAYLGIFVSTLKFILVDSVTDANPSLNTSFMFVKEYNQGADHLMSTGMGSGTDIGAFEALKRNFRWNMQSNPWVDYKSATTEGVFQAFHIPFTDLENLFADPAVEVLYVVFGLMSNDTPELILWNNITSFTEQSIMQDVSLPVPPFGGQQQLSGYQLLVQALAS